MSKVRLLAVLAITMVAGLMVTGCKSPMGLPSDVGIAGGWEDRQVYPFYDGDDSVGTVTVWNTLDSLYVQYDVDGDQSLEQTDLSVMTRAGDIPQREGNPSCGQFEFRSTWNDSRQSCSYKVPYRAGWGGKEICIATHAKVKHCDGGGHVIRRNDGWGGACGGGGGCRFGGRDRCRYIKYRFKGIKDVHLPCGSVSMTATYTGDVSNSYWAITLSNVSDVWTGTKLGWCVDPNTEMTQNTWLAVTLYSTGKPDLLPESLKNAGWDNVNYLLNNKLDDPAVTALDIQKAIWYLLGKGSYPSDNWPLSRQMIDDAVAHGNGWYPTCGDVIAVILEPTEPDEQLCIIEVDP